MTDGTVPGRRIVRRKSAIDASWSKALAEFDPALHEPIRRYFETRRAAYDAQWALSSLMTQHGVRWREIDKLATNPALGARAESRSQVRG